MKWSEVHAPAVCDWFPDSLVKEAKRLAKDVASVEKKRAKADDLAGVVADLGNDRTDYLRATIDALDAEQRVRDELVVFLTAREQAAGELRREAEKKILAVANKRRRELGIPDGCEIPLAVLQNTAAWWAARAELLACPVVDPSSDRKDHQLEIGRIERRIAELRAALAGEADRRARVVAHRRADAEFVGAGVAEYEAATAARDELHERAAELLK